MRRTDLAYMLLMLAGCSTDSTVSIPADDPDSLRFPYGAYIANDKLLVADTSNNRVLVWNSWPTEDGQDADFVLGQENLDVTTLGVTAQQIQSATKVTSNGTQIVVSDGNSRRTLIWDSFPEADGVAADHVLGQVDFESSVALTSQTGLTNPSGLALVGSRLIVSDTNSYRFLIYNSLEP